MKKKIISVLSLLLCIMVFPIIVHADMGIPEIKEYEAIVINPNGIVIEGYNKKVTVPCDEKITISSEFYDSEEKKMVAYASYDGVSGLIYLEDVKLYNKDVNLKDYNKLDKPVKLIAIEDVYMYNGPSRLYDRVDGDLVIPEGEIVSYEYYDDVWVYTEYNGVKGWIINYYSSTGYDDRGKSVAEVVNDGLHIYTTSKVDSLLVNPKKDEKIKVNIPKFEEIEYKYIFYDVHAEYVYIEYEGNKGWLYLDASIGPYNAVATKENECNSLISPFEDIETYDKYDDLSSKRNVKIPVGKELKVKYSIFSYPQTWYYVEYDGSYMWIVEKDYNDYALNNYNYIYIYKTLKNVTVYEKPDLTSKEIGKLDKDKKVNSYYSYSYEDVDYKSFEYIKDGDIKGWVYKEDLEYTDDYLEVCEVNNNREINNPGKNYGSDQKTNLVQIAIIAIVGALLGALVGFVTMLLVNKKKAKVSNEE